MLASYPGVPGGGGGGGGGGLERKQCKPGVPSSPPPPPPPETAGYEAMSVVMYMMIAATHEYIDHRNSPRAVHDLTCTCLFTSPFQHLMSPLMLATLPLLILLVSGTHTCTVRESSNGLTGSATIEINVVGE